MRHHAGRARVDDWRKGALALHRALQFLLRLLYALLNGVEEVSGYAYIDESPPSAYCGPSSLLKCLDSPKYSLHHIFCLFRAPTSYARYNDAMMHAEVLLNWWWMIGAAFLPCSHVLSMPWLLQELPAVHTSLR